MGSDRLRLERHRLAEGGLGFLALAAGQPQRAEVAVQRGLGIEADGQLHLLERLVEVREPGQRVGPQHQRVGVGRRQRDRLVGAGARLLEPPREQQQRSGADLDVGPLRQQVGRLDELRQRPRLIADLVEALGELELRVGELRLLGDGVAVLEDRLGQPALGGEALGRVVVALRALAAGGHAGRERQRGDDRRQPRRPSADAAAAHHRAPPLAAIRAITASTLASTDCAAASMTRSASAGASYGADTPGKSPSSPASARA